MTVAEGSVRLDDAALEWRSPVREKVPFLIGGNARRLVQLAARHGDVLELTGLGRTLPDGHTHEASWSAANVDERVRILHANGGSRVVIGTLLQKVEITPDRQGTAEAYRSLIGTILPEEHLPTMEEILEAPFLLFGTVDQIVAQVHLNQTRWGFTRYTTRETDLDSVARIIERLRGS